MSKSVAVFEDLYNKAAEIATKDHISTDEFVCAAPASHLASREFIASRARLYNRDEFQRTLNGIPDVEPDEHDRR